MTLFRNNGFTLIEVLVVIAIIAILAVIAIPQFTKFRKISYNASAKSDLKNAIISQEAYYAGNRVYAGSLDRLLTNDFVKSHGVELEINCNESSYTISSHHPGGDKTYMYAGPGGSIISN